VRGNALQFSQDHTQGLGAGRHIEFGKFLHSQTIDQVVANRVEVVQPVRHHLGLLVGFGLHVFLNAGVQKANIGDAGDDDFAIQFEQQAQHAMCGGVLGAHIEQHGFASEGAGRDQMGQFA